MHLAVNGTLMRGLELNDHLTEVHAEFLREDKVLFSFALRRPPPYWLAEWLPVQTVPAYRLYSISDRHPAMVRVASGGASIAVEVWALSPKALVHVLETEPPGLCVGKVGSLMQSRS